MFNEKGLTLIELLVSMTILMAVTVGTVQYFKHYAEESSEVGEYMTAKYITVDALEFSRSAILELGTQGGSIVHQGVSQVNGTAFEYQVLQEDVTPMFAVYSNDLQARKLTAQTKWKNREMEVTVYVSEP